MLTIIVIFVVVFILVLAFSSNEKEVEVTIRDPETGKETIEIRKEKGKSAGKEAAETTVALVIGVPLAIIFMFWVLSLLV